MALSLGIGQSVLDLSLFDLASERINPSLNPRDIIVIPFTTQHIFVSFDNLTKDMN